MANKRVKDLTASDLQDKFDDKLGDQKALIDMLQMSFYSDYEVVTETAASALSMMLNNLGEIDEIGCALAGLARSNETAGAPS